MTDLTKSTKKILVVEDDPEIRRIIAIALTQNTAQDGWFDALRETESNKKHRLGSCWVSYAQTESEFYKNAEKSGTVMFIPKPFSPKKLIVFMQLLRSS